MKVKGKKLVKKSRKQIRKEKRQEKKAKKNDYYQNRHKPGKFVLLPKNFEEDEAESPEPKITQKLKKPQLVDERTAAINKERKEQQKLQKQMHKQRRKQLKMANEVEDRNIKKLEKQLKLNKRKSKAVPQSFASDGLDYLLEVCDLENGNAFQAEANLLDLNAEFEEDFNLMTKGKLDNAQSQSNESENSDLDMDSDEGEQDSKSGSDISSGNDNKDRNIGSESDSDSNSDSGNDFDDQDQDSMKSYASASDGDLDQLPNSESSSKRNREEENETWEDIYGRKRSKTGEILATTEDKSKYVPPAIRAKMEATSSEDQKRVERLNKLKRLLKGLLNRLAESNMHSIATQMEDLYMNNSRNDMNETLTFLILDAIMTPIASPERLLMEHIMLVTILHANVGSEVGAHFLQTVVKKFNSLANTDQPVEDKTLDNVVKILAQLYNFKLYSAQLVYEVLDKLSARFGEKSVECILHVLKAVGFNLRKDDPVALKSLILSLQNKAANEVTDNSRTKFLLDVLLAIKNNNVTKIPNYDTSYSEHLKKLLKSFIRKGNYVTQLNITLEDLLKADERGKWWVVGSAWSGIIEPKKGENSDNLAPKPTESFSQKLLTLAKKQRMNTDTRRSIFCTIMSAEDYLDAFEKLLHLGLKNRQEQEIIHVILHCCLQEKNYNPFYGVLAQKFCDFDRKFQMAIKFSVWDKLKAITDSSTSQISNLAKLLTHLFLEKGLPISTLKIVQFSELDKVTLRFMRQTLLGILLHDDDEACSGVFEKISQSEKLKTFRDSLRLFIHHFLLKNLSSDGEKGEKVELLQERAKTVDKILTSYDKRTRF